MNVRRVVTGHNADGRSVVLWDSAAPASHDFSSIPGMSSTMLWATSPAGTPGDPSDDQPNDPGNDASRTVRSHVPGPGSTRFVIVDFPPDTVFSEPGFDPVAADLEQRQISPGLAELFEADNPGMHTTPTVDYVIVLRGQIWMELDDGAIVALGTGDTVVQNRTRHAWRNLGDQPATMAFVMIG
jgi:Cupin domain